MRWDGLIKEFKEFLPGIENTPMLSLNEGNTPLIRDTRSSCHLWCRDLSPGVMPNDEEVVFERIKGVVFQ